MYAIFVGRYGGPEVMTWTELPDPAPRAGEALVRLGVAGVNYMDAGVRTVPLRGWSFPTVLGVEGMGYVTALGDGVRRFASGINTIPSQPLSPSPRASTRLADGQLV